jgi:CheY-like chemotaxis protein
MPGFDGVETTRHLRQLVGNPNRRTPIIGLTADLHEARDVLLQAGMNACLYKPLDPEHLARVLRHWLHDQPQPRPLWLPLNSSKSRRIMIPGDCSIAHIWTKI